MQSSSAASRRARRTMRARGWMPTCWQDAEWVAGGEDACGAAGRETAAGARARSGRALDAELLHAGLEGRSLTAENPGGAAFAADPPAGFFENQNDVLALDLLEALRGLLRANAGRRRRRQHVGEHEASRRRKNDRPLDDVLQLPYVPGPGVGGQ